MTALRNLILAVCAAMTMWACDRAKDDTSAGTDDGDVPKVALIMKSLANEFFVTMADGAKEHHSNNPGRYELIVNGIRNESDLAQQVALIDQMIAARVKAIIIAPADSKAIVPALYRAQNAGIAVVNIDNKLDDAVLDEFETVIPFVGPNNRTGAYEVGKYLTARLAPSDKVAILEGIPTAFNSQERRAGFEEAASEAGLDVVTIQSAAWDQTKAVEITAAILIQHPDIRAIMCANDNMALGAVAALEQSGAYWRNSCDWV